MAPGGAESPLLLKTIVPKIKTISIQSFNAFSVPRPGRTLEQLEASKSKLPILIREM